MTGYIYQYIVLLVQFSDAVGWATSRASSLQKMGVGLLVMTI